jgi:hypothetical protein
MPIGPLGHREPADTAHGGGHRNFGETEAHMAIAAQLTEPTAVVTAVMLLVGLLGGVMAGIVTGASVGSRVEDRDYSLTGPAPDLLSEGARVVHGLFIRGTGFVSDTRRGDGSSNQIANEDEPGESSDHGAYGQELER